MLTRSCTWHGSVVREPRVRKQANPKPQRCPKCGTGGGKGGAKRPTRTTLQRHYYLEGGWGWVVVVVSVGVHVLSHGVQLAWPVAVPPTMAKFRTGYVETGESKIYLTALIYIKLLYNTLYRF